jgi:hypothetical protein
LVDESNLPLVEKHLCGRQAGNVKEKLAGCRVVPRTRTAAKSGE